MPKSERINRVNGGQTKPSQKDNAAMDRSMNLLRLTQAVSATPALNLAPDIYLTQIPQIYFKGRRKAAQHKMMNRSNWEPTWLGGSTRSQSLHLTENCEGQSNTAPTSHLLPNNQLWSQFTPTDHCHVPPTQQLDKSLLPQKTSYLRF